MIYSRVANFINQNNIRHVGVPLMNPKRCPWTSLESRVNSPIIQFLLKIRSAKISAHPFDGYGEEKAFVFEGQAAEDRETAIRILMSYITEVNHILFEANPQAQKITGIVLGELLGSPPFKDDKATSYLYRNIINESFDKSFTIGWFNGTEHINQRYYQNV